MVAPALDLDCPWCKSRFYICVSCWRGHVYCSPQCSAKARHDSLIVIRKRHAANDAGKASHLWRNRTYRLATAKNSETDHTSAADGASVAGPSSDAVEAITACPTPELEAEIACQPRPFVTAGIGSPIACDGPPRQSIIESTAFIQPGAPPGSDHAVGGLGPLVGPPTLRCCRCEREIRWVDRGPLAGRAGVVFAARRIVPGAVAPPPRTEPPNRRAR